MKNISIKFWNKKGSVLGHKNDVASSETIVDNNIILVDNFKGVGNAMQHLDEPRIKIIINGKDYEFINFGELEKQLSK